MFVCCLFIYFFVCLFIHLFIPFIYLFIYLLVCLFVCLFVYRMTAVTVRMVNLLPEHSTSVPFHVEFTVPLSVDE